MKLLDTQMQHKGPITYIQMIRIYSGYAHDAFGCSLKGLRQLISVHVVVDGRIEPAEHGL